VIGNGAEEQLDGSTSVADLVDRLGSGERGVAVAVNHDIVPRSCWSEHRLRDGDRVEVLRVAQGG
jgi:sulfur carrier protein